MNAAAIANTETPCGGSGFRFIRLNYEHVPGRIRSELHGRDTGHVL